MPDRNRLGIWLDYGEAADDPKLLRNLSAVACAGGFLWTSSDEGRSVECLERVGTSFQLKQQISLDSIFSALPGRRNQDEADIESIDVSEGRLWICGSHCRVRRRPPDDDSLDWRLRDRASRHLLGSATLTPEGGDVLGGSTALPFEGAGSLRAVLGANLFIAPFVGLPSKENGLDIEGMCISLGRLFVGLRGPLVDGIAIAFELGLTPRGRIKKRRPILHLIDLGGLGIRDLARFGRDVFVLAGPVSSADRPFRLFRWKPKQDERVQRPLQIWEWPLSEEHPEGICRFEFEGRPGVLALYDAPDDRRIRGSRYRAEWISLAGMRLPAMRQS